MDGLPAPEVQPAPAPQERQQRSVYKSPTARNAKELGWFAIFLLVLLVALAMPWLLVWQANRSGLNFDTWKLAQAGGGLERMMPLGAEDYLMGDEGLLAVYGRGMWALCKEYDNQAGAVEAWRKRWASGSWPDGVRGAATRVGHGQWLAFASMPDGRLLEWVSGRHIIKFFAWTDSDLTRMIVASDLIDGLGEKSFGVGSAPVLVRLLRFNAPWTALGLNVLTLLLLVGLVWYGTWRLSARPAVGSRRLGREALRTQLMALNSVNSPLLIEEQEPYHLIARWKTDDPQFAEWMASRNLRQAWQLDIFLGDNAWASVLETTGSISWDGRLSPPRPAFVWNYLRGAGEAPPTTPAGGDQQPHVLPTQSVDPADYRKVLQHVLLSNGWCIRPLLFRPLVWEYR